MSVPIKIIANFGTTSCHRRLLALNEHNYKSFYGSLRAKSRFVNFVVPIFGLDTRLLWFSSCCNISNKYYLKLMCKITLIDIIKYNITNNYFMDAFLSNISADRSFT